MIESVIECGDIVTAWLMSAKHLEIFFELATAVAFFAVSRHVTPTKSKPYKRLVPTVIAVGLVCSAAFRAVFGN